MKFPIGEPWLWWALLSALFTALTALLAKRGLRHINPDLAQLVPTVIVVGMMVAVVAGSGKWRSLLGIDRHTFFFLLLSGLSMGLSWICYFRGLKVGDASRVATVDKMSVVLVALVAWLMMGEQPGIKGWMAISLVASGIALMSIPK